MFKRNSLNYIKEYIKRYYKNYVQVVVIALGLFLLPGCFFKKKISSSSSVFSDEVVVDYITKDRIAELQYVLIPFGCYSFLKEDGNNIQLVTYIQKNIHDPIFLIKEIIKSQGFIFIKDYSVSDFCHIFYIKNPNLEILMTLEKNQRNDFWLTQVII